MEPAWPYGTVPVGGRNTRLASARLHLKCRLAGGGLAAHCRSGITYKVLHLYCSLFYTTASSFFEHLLTIQTNHVYSSPI